MAKELARIVRMAKESWTWVIGEDLVDFKGRAPENLYSGKDGEPDYKAICAYYGIEPGFEEKVVALSNPSALNPESSEAFRTGWVTSSDVLAMRNGKLPKDSFFPLAAIGVTLTAEDYLLAGVRAPRPKLVQGMVERNITKEGRNSLAHGLYGCPPAGSVSLENAYRDPILRTLVEEFKEEIGPFGIISIKPVGIVEAYQPGPTGFKFVEEVRTDATLGQIQNANRRANNSYENLVLRGANKQQIKEELENMRLPPDGWEHIVIEGFHANPKSLIYKMETQAFSFSGIGAGPLNLYSKYLIEQQIK